VRSQGELQPSSWSRPRNSAVCHGDGWRRTRVASEFLTWCNHRQCKIHAASLARGVGGAATELIRLIRSAPDLQAGFERLARGRWSRSARSHRFCPRSRMARRTTTASVTVSAELSSGSWHLAGSESTPRLALFLGPAAGRRSSARPPNTPARGSSASFISFPRAAPSRGAPHVFYVNRSTR